MPLKKKVTCLEACGGANTALICGLTSRRKKDKNQQMQLKKMMLQMLQQPKLNPLRKQNSSSRG